MNIVRGIEGVFLRAGEKLPGIGGRISREHVDSFLDGHLLERHPITAGTFRAEHIDLLEADVRRRLENPLSPLSREEWDPLRARQAVALEGIADELGKERKLLKKGPDIRSSEKINQHIREYRQARIEELQKLDALDAQILAASSSPSAFSSSLVNTGHFSLTNPPVPLDAVAPELTPALSAPSHTSFPGRPEPSLMDPNILGIPSPFTVPTGSRRFGVVRAAAIGGLALTGTGIAALALTHPGQGTAVAAAAQNNNTNSQSSSSSSSTSSGNNSSSNSGTTSTTSDPPTNQPQPIPVTVGKTQIDLSSEDKSKFAAGDYATDPENATVLGLAEQLHGTSSFSDYTPWNIAGALGDTAVGGRIDNINNISVGQQFNAYDALQLLKQGYINPRTP